MTLPARRRCRRHVHRHPADRRGHRRDATAPRPPSTPQDQSVGVLRGIDKVCAAGRHRAGAIGHVHARHDGRHQRDPGGQGRPGRPGRPPAASGRCCRSPGPSCPAGWPAGSSGRSPSRWPRWRTPSRPSSASAPTARWSPQLDEDDLRAKLRRLGGRRRRGARASALINSYRQRRARAARSPSSPPRSCPACRCRCPRSVLPEMREYERTLTTVANGVRAAAGRRATSPTSAGKLADSGVSGTLYILRSDGGLASAAAAADEPGLAAAVRPGRRRHRRGLGGRAGRLHATCSPSTWAAPPPTSALVQDGSPRIGRETTVGDLNVRAPSVDVRTVGAGGGSIAHVPELTQALRVGPAVGRRRRPARPRTAAAASEPTVTDANVVLGYLPTAAGRRRDRRSTVEAARDRGRRPSPTRWACRASRPPRPASSTSSTRTCSARCGWSRCSRASTRATSRWSPSAAPARCTPTRSAG